MVKRFNSTGVKIGPPLQEDEANCKLLILNSAIVGCFTFVPTDRKAMKCSLMLITERLRPLAVYLNEVYYDNMKTVVDQVGKGKERHINKRFQVMTGHYLFEPEFCNRAAGWEKGQVEKCVLERRHQVWQEAPSFMNLPELNG